MTAVTDFSFQAMVGRLEELLVLVLLAAMIYCGVAYTRRRPGLWPKVFGWASLVALLVDAARVSAEFVQDGLRAGSPSLETPDLPVSYETWAMLGGVATFLFGGALLACGLALVFVGWQEGKTARRTGKRKRA